MFSKLTADVKVLDLLENAGEGRFRPVEEARECKMCGAHAPFYISMDFSKNSCSVPIKQYGIAVNHYRCEECEHIFTDFCDDWGPEEFAKYIYNESYVVVDPEYDGTRSKDMAKVINDHATDETRALSILDYGAGNSYLEQHLREYGFADVRGWDPYAGGEYPDRKFDVVAAYEVLEHSPQPREMLSAMLGLLNEGGVAFCSQAFIPDDIDALRDKWFYFGPRNGHISFFSIVTIIRYAKEQGLNLKIAEGGFYFWRGELAPAVKAYVDSYLTDAVVLDLKGAPLAGQVVGWHHPEDDASGQFHWTARSKCPLGVLDIAVKRTYISLPVLIWLTEDHLKDCSLLVDEVEVPLKWHDNHLIGCLNTDMRGKAFVWLVTPPPLRPVDIGRGDDERPMGLAISVAREPVEGAEGTRFFL